MNTPRVASHREDIDGIISAALIKRIYPNAEIILTTPHEILRNKYPYDFVLDLPKPENCRVNIDHHETNLQRLLTAKKLSENDLIDPSAPSAASLVAKYFGLNDKISRELVDMANRADRGIFDEKLLILDFFIKENINNTERLLWLIDKLAQLGAKIFDDPAVISAFQPYYGFLAIYNTIRDVIIDLINRNIKIAVFNSTRLPYSIVKIPPSLFVQMGGILGVSYYIDPLTGYIRFSIRVSSESKFHANKIAQKFGGGGHKHAAGFHITRDDKLGHVLYELTKIINKNSILVVNLNGIIKVNQRN